MGEPRVPPRVDDGQTFSGGQPTVSWPIPTSRPSRRTSITPTSASTACAGSSSARPTQPTARSPRSRSRRGRCGGLRTFEDAEQGLCFGRLDLETTPRPLYVGRRWVHDEESEPLVVNWQAPAARPFYVATPADPHGVTLRRRFRTEGRRLLDLERRAARRLRAPSRAATSCSTSSSGAGRRTCATSSRRSRPTSTGSSPAPPSRRSSSRAGREPARPRSGSTAPRTCSTPTRDRLRRVLVVGPNPTFMEYVSHVLPSLGEERVEQRAVTELVDGLDVTVADTAETARLKGDLRLAEVLARAAAQRSPAATRGARRPARGGVRAACASARWRSSSRPSATSSGSRRRRASGSGWTCCGASTRTTARGSAGSPGVTSARSSALLRAKGFLARWLDRVWPDGRGRRRSCARSSPQRTALAEAADGILDAPEQALLLAAARAVRLERGDVALVDEAHALLGRAAAHVRARDRRRGAGPDADAAPRRGAARERRLADAARRHRPGDGPRRPPSLGGRARARCRTATRRTSRSSATPTASRRRSWPSRSRSSTGSRPTWRRPSRSVPAGAPPRIERVDAGRPRRRARSASPSSSRARTASSR